MEAIDGKYVAQDVAPGAPDWLVALVRLAKPGIVTAVLLAGFAGMVTAGRGLPEPGTALICLVSLLLAAAGSAMLNCLLDQAPDRKMGRLDGRVRALNAVGPASLLGTALACIAVALLLAANLNRFAFLLTLAAVILYALIYTLILKRRSPWGAIPGGIPGALPVLIGQAAVSGALEPAGLILFAAVFLWQPPHFWLLALRYQDDYRAAGIPVLPVVCGEAYTRVLVLLYASALLPATLLLPLTGCCSPFFAPVAGALWLWFMAACWHDAVRARRFERAFRASLIYLTVLLAAVILDIVIVG